MEGRKMKRLILILAIAVFLAPLTVAADPDKETSSSNEEESAIAQSSRSPDSSSVSAETQANRPRVHFLLWWEVERQEIAWQEVKEENNQVTKEAIAEDILFN